MLSLIPAAATHTLTPIAPARSLALFNNPFVGPVRLLPLTSPTTSIFLYVLASSIFPDSPASIIAPTGAAIYADGTMYAVFKQRCLIALHAYCPVRAGRYAELASVADFWNDSYGHIYLTEFT